MIFSDEHHIVHRRPLDEECFYFEVTLIQHITICHILQYTFYLNKVSWPYTITQQQIITGNVAMVTKGIDLTRNCNIFPRFPYYFAVVASEYKCILIDFMVCWAFVLYLHHELTR